MKKIYLKPSMKVVKLQHRSPILANSIHSLNSNVGLSYGGGSDDEDDFDAR